MIISPGSLLRTRWGDKALLFKSSSPAFPARKHQSATSIENRHFRLPYKENRLPYKENRLPYKENLKMADADDAI